MNGQVHKKVRRAVIQSIVDECQATSQGHEFLLDNSENEISLPPGHSELISQLDGFEHLLSRPLSPEEADHKRFAEALKLFSPDDRRGNGTITGQGEDYLGVVFAGASIGAHDVVKEWAMRSDKFEEAEFESSYRSWGKTDNPVTVRSLYYHLSNRQSNPTIPKKGSLSALRGMSSTGKSEEMKKRMLDDVFVIKDMAIRGQMTVFAAPPNAGKTLFTLAGLIDSVVAGRVDGDRIFYVNADDHGKGAVEKTEIVEPYKIEMLIPNENGFKSKALFPIMREAIQDGEARGTVIVLDTLKKFTDLMDKKASSEFTNLAREFCGAGGTLILLIHCNKRREKDGSLLVAGTSDITDDSDCVYVFDPVGESDGVHTVECEMRKCRGDVAATVSFHFKRAKGQSYKELLGSVKILNDFQLECARETQSVRHRLEENSRVIEAIIRRIKSNYGMGIQDAKNDLIKHISTTVNLGQKKVRKVLECHEGEDYEKGFRWRSVKVGNARTVYEVLDPPSIS